MARISQYFARSYLRIPRAALSTLRPPPLTALCNPDPPVAPFQQSLLDGNRTRVGNQHDHRNDDCDFQGLSDHPCHLLLREQPGSCPIFRGMSVSRM